MKKLYAGLAAAALTATGIACTAGAANADLAPGSSLGYAPGGDGSVSTAVGTDGTVYTAAVNADWNGLTVSATTASGTTTRRAIAMGDSGGVSAFVVTSTGRVVLSGWQDDQDEALWTASANSVDVTKVGTDISDGNGVFAASPDGSQVAFSDDEGEVAVIDLKDNTVTTHASIGSDDASPAVDAVAVDDSGNAQVVGDDSASVPRLWTVAAGATSALPNPEKLSSEPDSVAVAGSKILVGEIAESGDDETYSLEVFDGDSHSSITLPTYADFLTVSPDGNTVFAAGSDFGEHVDLTKLDSYADNPVTESYLTDGVVGLAASSTSLYVIASPRDDDYNRTTASLLTVTKPGSPTTLSQSVYSDGSIQVQWTAPAQKGGGDLTYVVTAKDKKSGKVITHETTDTSDYLTSGQGLQAGHTYDVTVRAENAAFSSADVAVPAVLSGTATVTVSGSAVVGGALTAAVSKSTFPAGTKLSYQWGYWAGQYGGGIDGADKPTYSPTKDMVGMHVSVTVTASLKGFSPAQVQSNAVVVRGATPPIAQAPAPAPVKVTKIKAAKIKSSSKKLKLKLPGVTTAPGKVKVFDGKKLIGKAKIKNGKLVLKLKKKLHKGKHKITLKYAGSAKVAKFHKSVKVKVK